MVDNNQAYMDIQSFFITGIHSRYGRKWGDALLDT